MSVETPNQKNQSSILRLQQTLNSCSQSIGSEASLDELVCFLNSVSESALSHPDDNDSINNAFEVVSELHRLLISPQLDLAVIDALSFELPKAAAKFGVLSERCLEVAYAIIDRFVVACNPRDMLSILCEALDSSSELFNSPGYFAPILSGLSKVLVSIQRRHFENVKVAVPAILNVFTMLSSDFDDGDTNYEDIFNRVIDIGDSIQAICTNLEGKGREKLCALLGLYVFQIMFFFSIRVRGKDSRHFPLIIRLSQFLPYCGLSYIGLITGSDVDTITTIVLADDGDDNMSCFSYVNHGACLAVIWGCISDEVAQHSKDDLTVVKDELRRNQTKRWQAVGMLKNILTSVNLPWVLKNSAIGFLLCILDGSPSQECKDEHLDCSIYMPRLFAALQAIEMVIMYAQDGASRKNAFSALKLILADVPTSTRFEILRALITNSNSSSMTAILVDQVRAEMRTESVQRLSTSNGGATQAGCTASHSSLFLSASVLEVVELVLRPPKGGPPPLPEHSDAVLAALNLYRFVLITESTGKSNYTGALSKVNLQKAYNEWLLPLRTLVSGIAAENKQDYDQLAIDMSCALNPVELVLYRCIELVEENLKHST